MRGLSYQLLWFLVLQICLQIGHGKIYKRSVSRKTPKERRTWGGMDTNTGPNFGGWLLRILDSKGEFACGGAYYAPLLAITSANCIYPHRNNLHGAAVEGTAFSKCDPELYSEIDTVHIPEKFIYHKRFMDVALVRLKTPIKGLLTEFIKLCSVDLVPGMSMTVFGWGFDSMEVQKPTTHPRSAEVTMEAIPTCRRKYGMSLLLASTSVCVKQPKNSNDCLYDGGCPLIYGNELCGIVSLGSQCQNTSYPGIFTNIKRVVTFITETEEAIRSGTILRTGRKTTKHPKKPMPRTQPKPSLLQITKKETSTTENMLDTMVCEFSRPMRTVGTKCFIIILLFQYNVLHFFR